MLPATAVKASRYVLAASSSAMFASGAIGDSLSLNLSLRVVAPV